MLNIVRNIGQFFGEFLRNEQSQMTKTGFLSIASTIAVLGIGLLPSAVYASHPCGIPCSDCGWQCDVGSCTYQKVQCSGTPCNTGSMWHKVCPGVDTCVSACFQ